MRTQIHWSVFRQLNFKTFIYLSLTSREMEKKLYFFNLQWSRACGFLVDEFSGKIMKHKFSVRLESKWRTNDADEPRQEKNNTFGQHTIANWTEANQNTTPRECVSSEETEGKHHHGTYTVGNAKGKKIGRMRIRSTNLLLYSIARLHVTLTSAMLPHTCNWVCRRGTQAWTSAATTRNGNAFGAYVFVGWRLFDKWRRMFLSVCVCGKCTRL